MNKYSIAPRADGNGFDVHIVSHNGARQTALAFATEAEAQVWIAQDKRLTRAADPFRVQGGPFGQS